MPSLIFTGRYGAPIDPRTLNRKFTARATPREYLSSQFVTPGIYVPRCSSTCSPVWTDELPDPTTFTLMLLRAVAERQR